MSRLLNSLRAFPSTRARLPVSADMKADIAWWLDFLPIFNGTSLIKPIHWEFDDLQFTTDASLHAGGATCLNECFTREFPEDIVRSAGHITALELLFTTIVYNYCCSCQVLGSQAFPPQIPCVMRQRSSCYRCQLWFFEGSLHATLFTGTMVYSCRP